LNDAIEKAKAKCKKFSNEEFLTGLGLIAGSAEFSQKKLLYLTLKRKDLIMMMMFGRLFFPHLNLSHSCTRFKDFRQFLPSIYVPTMHQRERVIHGISLVYQLKSLMRFNELG
jgi:hypothetical protein